MFLHSKKTQLKNTKKGDVVIGFGTTKRTWAPNDIKMTFKTNKNNLDIILLFKNSYILFMPLIGFK